MLRKRECVFAELQLSLQWHTSPLAGYGDASRIAALRQNLTLLRSGLRAFSGEHAAEPINHIAITPVDHVSIRRLEFHSFAGSPRSPAQHAPIANAGGGSSLITITTPFPDVAADVEQSQRVRFKVAGRTGLGKTVRIILQHPATRAFRNSRAFIGVIARAIRRRPLLAPWKF